MDQKRPLVCPSAQPGMRRLRVIGVIERTETGPRLAYLNEEVAATPTLLDRAAPAAPTEVYRLAADCEGCCCVHFDGRDCKLATRIVQILPAVVEELPVCMVRSTCRWYEQERGAACLRCPQVVTECAEASADYRRAAAPDRQTGGTRMATS